MDDAARRATQEVEAAIVQWRSQDDGELSYNALRDLIINRFATALREMEAEREKTISKLLASREEIEKALVEIRHWHGLAHQYSDLVLKLRNQNDALATRLARVEGALRPFTSGGNWGKWKAWLVEGARHLGKISEGLDAAQAITRWQCQVDEAVAVLTPDATTEGT